MNTNFNISTVDECNQLKCCLMVLAENELCCQQEKNLCLITRHVKLKLKNKY